MASWPRVGVAERSEPARSFRLGCIRLFDDVAALSHRLRRCVDSSVLGQPSHVSPLGVILDFAKKLNRFRFVAWFARIIDGDDHFDLYRNNELVSLNQPRSLDSLSWYSHGLTSVEEVDGHQFSDTTLPQI
jgi:hypothetical protein